MDGRAREPGRIQQEPHGATSQSRSSTRSGWFGVAELASQDAGGVPSELLGDYLPMLADAATIGQFPERAEIDAVRGQGRSAAEQECPWGEASTSICRRHVGCGASFRRSSENATARRCGRQPKRVLQVVDDAVASFAEGHAEAGRELIRREETLGESSSTTCFVATLT